MRSDMALSFWSSSILFAVRSLARRYDLVYVHNMPDILGLSSLIPKALGAKVVLDLHDPMPELMMTIFGVSEDKQKRSLMKRLEKWSIGRVDLAVTVNIACKRIFSRTQLSCGEDCGGHECSGQPDFPISRGAGRTACQTAAGNKPFVIMYHGSLVERNGLDVAIDALAKVRRG